METGLFAIQAEHLREFKRSRQVQPESRKNVYAMIGRVDSIGLDQELHGNTEETEALHNSGVEPVDPAAEFARCFLRLANLPNYALDRLSRYEATLWRQVAQILFALDALERRKPQERGRRFRLGSRPELPADEREDC
jgi:hypothetical protein